MDLIYFYEDTEIGETVDERDTKKAVAEAAEFRKVTRTMLGTLEIDATLSEDETRSLALTDHPVERGASISDHKRLEPATITLKGLVSDTPIHLDDNSSQEGRGADAWEKLRELQAADTLVTIVTSNATYENMAITSLNRTRDAQTGNVLVFTATLREVFFATSETVEAPAERPPKKKLGKKQKTPAEEPQKKSLLKKGLDALLGG